MLKQNFKKILMLTILFTIIISFNLIGASAITPIDLDNSMTIDEIETEIKSGLNDFDDTEVSFTLGGVDEQIFTRSIKIPAGITYIYVEGAGNVSLTSGSNLFSFTTGTELRQIEINSSYENAGNAAINSPSSFNNLNYYDGVGVNGKIYLHKNEPAVYTSVAGVGLTYFGDPTDPVATADAVANIVSDGAILYIVIDEEDPTDPLALVDLGNLPEDGHNFVVNARNANSKSSKVYFDFTIDEQVTDDTQPENTITLPSNGYFDPDASGNTAVYITSGTNKKFYANANVAMEAIGTKDKTLLLLGSPHDLTDVDKNVIVKGLSDDTNGNVVNISFKDSDEFSSTKVILRGEAYSSSTPYTANDGVNTHYKEGSIARCVDSGSTIFIDYDGTTCDLGTINRNLVIKSIKDATGDDFEYANSQIEFSPLEGFDFTVKMFSHTKTGTAFFTKNTDTDPLKTYRKYYSNSVYAAKQAASASKTLYLNANSNTTYNIGSVTDNLNISVNPVAGVDPTVAYVSYTNISGKLSLSNGAVCAGGVYLIKDSKNVYYNDAATAIAKLNKSNYKDFSDDKILYLNGAPDKVHNLGDIKNTLQVFGKAVAGDKAVISYKSLSDTEYLELIGNETINSNGGSYLYEDDAINVNGEDYDTRTYFGSLTAAYNYADDLDDTDDNYHTVWLDESDTVYDLSSAGYDWNEWKIRCRSDEGATFSLSGISYTTLNVYGGAKSSQGCYIEALDDDGEDCHQYYKVIGDAIDESTGEIFVDECDTAYNLGAITADLIVRGDDATVTYDSLDSLVSLTLDKDTNMATGKNDVYVLLENKDKVYCNNFDNTLIYYNADANPNSSVDVICATGIVNVGTVTDDLTIKGVGTSPVFVKYESIDDTIELTLQGNAQHYEYTGGIFRVTDDGDRIYYASPDNAVEEDAVIYFEKMKDSTPYTFEDDIVTNITCRPDTTETGTVKIQYAIDAGGSVKILKSDVDKDKFEVVDQGLEITEDEDTDVRIDDNPDVEVMIENTKSGEQSYTYYYDLSEAVDAYDDNSYEIIKLTQDAQSNIDFEISKPMVIMGMGMHYNDEDDDDDDEPYPTIIDAVVTISTSDVSLYNLEFQGATGVELTDTNTRRNITIEKCVFDCSDTGIIAPKVENCEVTGCTFELGYSTGIETPFDFENNFDITNNIFLEVANDIVVDAPEVNMEDDNDDDEEKQYISVLMYGNFTDEDKTQTGVDVVYTEDFAVDPVEIGNCFLKYLKVANEDIYEYGKSDFYKIVDPSVSKVLIETEVDDTDSKINSGGEKYSKKVSLKSDNFTEFSFTVTDENDITNDYTIHIYRKAQASDSISRTVFDEDELQDVIRLISSASSTDSNLSKGIIYEAQSKTELTVSEDDIEELKTKNIDLTINLNNGFMSIDVSKLDDLWPGDTYYKFVTSIPTGTIANPTDDDIALKRVNFTVLSMPSGREIDVDYGIISGITTDGIDFDKYDSSTIKVYYYNPTTKKYEKEISAEYYVAEQVAMFTAPHYSEYVLTAQEATAESYKKSLTATLVDENDDPLANYKVNIDGSSRTTNSAGEVTFSSIENSSGSIQILDDGNNSVFSGTYTINEGSSNTWSASNDKLVVTHTSDVTTLDLLFEFVSDTNVNVTDVDFYSNPKTGFPFFTSVAGYITIALILAALVGLGFFVRKKFFLKQA